MAAMAGKILNPREIKETKKKPKGHKWFATVTIFQGVSHGAETWSVVASTKGEAKEKFIECLSKLFFGPQFKTNKEFLGHLTASHGFSAKRSLDSMSPVMTEQEFIKSVLEKVIEVHV
jgi:hypothetical protein